MSEPIEDYDVLVSGDLANLILQIKEWVKKGWEPVGGISSSVYQGSTPSSSTLWSQAIVRKTRDIDWEKRMKPKDEHW